MRRAISFSRKVRMTGNRTCFPGGRKRVRRDRDHPPKKHIAKAQAYLFARFVPLDNPIDRGRLPGLGMAVLGADRVHLHVRSLCFHKLLVYVASVATDFVDLGVELGRSIPNFPKELLTSTSRRGRVVNCNVVIFGVHLRVQRRK
jgi:hypothetical protein